MLIAFYVAGIVAVLSTLIAITQRHVVHALLYLIVSLLAVAVDFYILGAPFLAALEIMIYAGAIMVLFLFVVMMLNSGSALPKSNVMVTAAVWFGPCVLAAILFAEIAYVVSVGEHGSATIACGHAQATGIALFGPYVIGVELVSLLLTAGLVGAYHLGRRSH